MFTVGRINSGLCITGKVQCSVFTVGKMNSGLCITGKVQCSRLED